MIKHFLLIAFLFLTFFTTLTAQTPEKALENIKTNYTKENIFIHYDKNVYVVGETIWYKAYITAGVIPTPYSTAINVELLNDSGRIISRQILPVLGGAATGALELSKDAPQMTYTIRAYTRRMMNFGSSFFYEKQLQVFNPSKTPAAAVASKETIINFLPEGGNLVAGVANAVAFKVTDKYGYPLDAEGQLKDSKGNEIVAIKTTHDGMGKFYFLPQPDEIYSAEITIKGDLEKVMLPHVKFSGTTLQVQSEGSKKYFIINKEKAGRDELVPAYLLAIMENTVLFRQDISAATDFVRGELPMTKLPSGILQLTLFNKNDQPLAERMLFVNNKDFLLKGDLKTDTVSLKKRGRNSFSFVLEDSFPGTFSIAITDINREISTDSRENIISSLMLSNDIKGYIHNPLYYFEGDDADRQNALDLVMMTNGWRRFNWEQLLNKRLPPLSYKDGNYISVMAKAYRAEKNTLLTNTSINVFVNTRDSASEFLQVDADKEGMISIPGMIFQDTATISFQENAGKDRKVAVSMYQPSLSKLFMSVPRSLVGFVKPIDEGLVKEKFSENIKYAYGYSMDLENQKIISLKDVRLASIRAKSKTKLVQERYLTGLFANGMGKTLDFITNPEKAHHRNIFEYLRGRESSVIVSGGPIDYSINYRSARSLMGGLLPMSIFLDGALVDPFFVATIPLRDIAMVQIRGSGFVGAEGNGAGGVLAIFSKKGEDIERSSRMAGNLSSVKIEGFSPVKEFFSPDYAKTATPGDDKRTTIFWDPYIETVTGKNTVRIPFFNSDHAEKFRVVLTGMTSEGKMLYIEKIIE